MGGVLVRLPEWWMDRIEVARVVDGQGGVCRAGVCRVGIPGVHALGVHARGVHVRVHPPCTVLTSPGQHRQQRPTLKHTKVEDELYWIQHLPSVSIPSVII